MFFSARFPADSRLVVTACLGVFLVFGQPENLFAQSAASARLPTPEEREALRIRYEEEPAVYLYHNEQLRIGWKSGKLDIRQDHDSRMLFFSNSIPALATRNLAYTSFSRISDIRAETLVPVRNKYQTYPVTAISDESSISGGIFYDDRREKSFFFPGIQAGALGDLHYTEEILEPRFLGAFYFQSYVPIEEAVFSVTIDTGISLQYKLLGHEAEQVIRFEQEQVGDQRVYRWTAKEQAAWSSEDNAPSLLLEIPHVVVYLEQVGAEPLLSGVPGLYRWYRSLTDSVSSLSNEEVRLLTEQITRGKTDSREKAQALFAWVQDNIRYVAFEDGLGGFVPRDAGLVFHRKYGDCKDMANLLCTMLVSAGLPAQLTWIGTRDIPYRYEEVPTPLVDNHMIAALILPDDTLFLDATDNTLAFGFPSSFIQGKQALVADGPSYRLIEVPEIRADQNRMEERAVVHWNGRQLEGQGRSSWSGYPAFEMRRRLGEVRPDGMPRFLSGALELGNNKFSVAEHQFEGLSDRNAPLAVDFHFTVPDYVKEVGDEVFINLQLDRRLRESQIDAERRKRDRVFDYRTEHVHEVALEIPEGYRLQRFPEPVTWEHPGFGFNLNYRQEGNQVIMHREIRLDTLQLGVADFPRWNEMIRQLNSAYREMVVLVRDAGD